MTAESKLLLQEEAFRIRGAAFAVGQAMGHGFLQAVYQECLAIEFSARGIDFRPMPRLRLCYRGVPLQQTYAPDFICFEKVIVELKAVAAISPEHRSQVLNYLNATGLSLGLLINFGGGPKVQIERFALTSGPRMDADRGQSGIAGARGFALSRSG